MAIVPTDKPVEFRPRIVPCPKHKEPMKLRRTYKYTYADGSPKWFYYCRHWPFCTISVSAHPDGEPMGDPGDERTKAARAILHMMFDPLWQCGAVTRDDAYAWLVSVTGLSPEECHIGKFNEEMCLIIIYLIRLMKEEPDGNRKEGSTTRRWHKRISATVGSTVRGRG